MTNDCADLNSEAGNAGDRHYRAMGTWLRSGMPERLRKKAHRAALKYRQALKFFIDCYTRVRHSAAKKSGLGNALKLESLVAKDIEILERHEPMQ